MSSEPNTFYTLDEIKDYINDKLDEYYKEELVCELNNFYLMYCNEVDVMFYYDITNINCVFECIQYVNEKHNDMYGEDIPIGMIDTQDKLTHQLISWIGEEWRCKKEEEEEGEDKCGCCECKKKEDK